jgi:hypothetical protein
VEARRRRVASRTRPARASDARARDRGHRARSLRPSQAEPGRRRARPPRTWSAPRPVRVSPARRLNRQRSACVLLVRLVTDPGFVSARVLESEDRTSLAAFVEMRSVEDRQRLEQVPDVRDTLHHLHAVANLIISLYHEVHAYHSSRPDRRRLERRRPPVNGAASSLTPRREGRTRVPWLIGRRSVYRAVSGGPTFRHSAWGRFASRMVRRRSDQIAHGGTVPRDPAGLTDHGSHGSSKSVTLLLRSSARWPL